MKSTLQSSQGVKVRVVEYEDSDVVALVAAGKVAELTTAINADRRQKVALVEFRSDLSERIEKLGFARKTEQVTKEGETVEIPAETEGEHIKRFVTGLADDSVTAEGFTPSTGDAKAKETAAYAFLQSLASLCGDKTDENGNPAYVLDVTRVARTSTGLKGALPKYALDAAAQIIKNNSQQKWITNFTNGYTSASGVAIDPIPFESFVESAPAGSTPEQIEAVNQSNIKHLAAAIKAVRTQEDAKRAPEFV